MGFESQKIYHKKQMSTASCEFSRLPRNSVSDTRLCPVGEVTATHSLLAVLQQKKDISSKVSAHKMGASPHYPWMPVTATQLLYKCLCHKNYTLYISC